MIEGSEFPHLTPEEIEALTKSGEVVKILRNAAPLIGDNQPIWEKYLDKAESRMDGFRFVGTENMHKLYWEGDKLKVKVYGKKYKFESQTSPRHNNLRFSLGIPGSRFCEVDLWTLDIRGVQEGSRVSFSYIAQWIRDEDTVMTLSQENILYNERGEQIRGSGNHISITIINNNPLAKVERSYATTHFKREVPIEEALVPFIEPS